MDPTHFIAPGTELGQPAPLWFLFAFKVIGFLLHVIPMSLWFIGFLLALILAQTSHTQAQQLSRRLGLQMPIIVAMGINFGIVPLLFLQVLYGRVFYPATILMAWPWFSIIILLPLAYYGVYLYAIGLKKGGPLPKWRIAAGWLAACVFVHIGTVWTRAMTLLTNLPAWEGEARRTDVAGAVTGWASNWGDPTIWWRFLLFCGLATMTVAIYCYVDSILLARQATPAYRAWVASFSTKIFLVGLVAYGVFGSLYLKVLPVRATMLAGTWLPVTALAIGLPVVVLLLLVALGKKQNAFAAFVLGLAQIAVMGLHAVVRQGIQFTELGKYLDLSEMPVHTQVLPIVIFLLLFVGAVGTVLWMLWRLVAEGAQARPATGTT